MRRRASKALRRQQPRWTVRLRRRALGRLEVTLPPEVCESLGPLGSRVWFATRLGSVEVGRDLAGLVPPKGAEVRGRAVCGGGPVGAAIDAGTDVAGPGATDQDFHFLGQDFR